MSLKSPPCAVPAPVPQIQRIIRQLNLQAHPEGGWYSEVFRSDARVRPADGRSTRTALTSIHFLLPAGQHSRWHCVQSDEVWIHLGGAPLDLWTWQPTVAGAPCTRLGRWDVQEHESVLHDGALQTQQVVAAGHWQAARPVDDAAQPFSLVACVVGPGFDFSDFRLMEADGNEARLIAAQHPELALFI